MAGTRTKFKGGPHPIGQTQKAAYSKRLRASGPQQETLRKIRKDPLYTQSNMGTRVDLADNPEFGRNENPYSNRNVANRAKRAKNNFIMGNRYVGQR